MRLFIALDIEESIRQRISRFMEGIRELAPDARWVRPESLHVTLKFIGEKSAEAAEQIKLRLASVHAEEVALGISGYGFFPSPKSARVFWIGISADQRLPDLARKVDAAVAGLGIPKEEHSYTPHLTLARGGSGSGNPRHIAGDDASRNFQKLHERLSSLSTPDFGAMTAREFYLFQSQLQPGGARYTKIATFPLHSPERKP